MNTVDPKQVRDSAEATFNAGFCCSEAALLAIARELGITSPHVPGVASGFCGGMARTGGPCGALTGAMMGLGLALGRQASDQAAQPASQATQRLIREFREMFGSTDCHVLVGFDPKSERAEIDTAFNKEGRRERCARLTGMAAEMAANIIQESQSR